MRILKIALALVSLLSLTGCGIGEFLVKREINGIEKDIAKQMKSFATFNKEQEAVINEFAEQAADYVKQSRLPKLHDEMQLIAADVETHGQLQDDTWQSTVNFLESPFALSEADGLIDMVAVFVYSMSEGNIAEAATKLEQDYQKNNERRANRDPYKRDKKIARGIKILFAELGAKRSKAQIESAMKIIRQRRSWLLQEEDIENLAHRQFITVISDRSVSQDEFIARFKNIWQQVESGSRRGEPEIWEHNSRIGLQGVNQLLDELDTEERKAVAKNIRRYARLFNSYSSTE